MEVWYLVDQGESCIIGRRLFQYFDAPACNRPSGTDFRLQASGPQNIWLVFKSETWPDFQVTLAFLEMPIEHWLLVTNLQDSREIQ